jgi:GNAT superfamily N-acetyltransferase
MPKGRTQGRNIPAEVTQVVASYRKKWPAYQFFLARKIAWIVPWRWGALCQWDGMVEDLFTYPTFAKRGIATAIIARAIPRGIRG